MKTIFVWILVYSVLNNKGGQPMQERPTYQNGPWNRVTALLWPKSGVQTQQGRVRARGKPTLYNYWKYLIFSLFYRV